MDTSTSQFIFANNASMIQNMLCCTLCKNLFIIDIYINENNENICEKCTGSLTYPKNTALMKIIQNMQVSCKFYKKPGGCDKVFLFKDLAFHQDICRYRLINCTLDKTCPWKGTLDGLNNHVDANHKTLICIENAVSFRHAMNKDFKTVRQVIVGSKRFLLKLEYDNKYKILNYLVYRDLNNNTEEETFSIKFTSKVTGSNYELCQKVFTGHYEDTFKNIPNYSLDIMKLQYLVDLSGNVDILVKMPGFNPTKDNPIKDTLRLDLLRALECPVCSEVMSGNVYQCEIGHSVCSNCKWKGLAVCPTCRGKMGAQVLNQTSQNGGYTVAHVINPQGRPAFRPPGRIPNLTVPSLNGYTNQPTPNPENRQDIRNYTVEGLATLILPCSYQNFGCPSSFPLKELKKHEDICKFGKLHRVIT